MVMTTSLAWTASVVSTFGVCSEMSMPLAHGLHDGRVDLLGGQATGGADLDRAGGEGGEETGGHLGTAGVVHADEQHGGRVGQGSTFQVRRRTNGACTDRAGPVG